jgi:hypothetical protein
MYGWLPEWGRFTPDPGGTVRLRATDTGDSWLVTPGRFTGTDPDDGTSYEEAAVSAAGSDSGAAAAAEISGTAADLDCWLWHRAPVGAVQRSGDPGAIGGFDTAIGPGIS